MVDAPGAYATAAVQTSLNQLACYNAADEPNIAAVDAADGHITFVNPWPASSTGEWRLPFWSTANGYDTALATIPLCNRADWGGANLTYTYDACDSNGQPITYVRGPVPVPAAPGMVPGDGPDGPISLSSLYNYGFAELTGAMKILTRGCMETVNAYVFLLHEGGIAIGIIPPERPPVELVGQDRIDSGGAGGVPTSVLVKYNRRPEDIGEVTLKIEKKAGTEGSVDFENGHDTMTVTGTGIVWLYGHDPSDEENLPNFTIKSLKENEQQELEQQGPSLNFYVMDTDKAFEDISINWDVGADGNHEPMVEGRDPVPCPANPNLPLEQKIAGLRPGMAALNPHPPGYMATFHWDPWVKISIDQWVQRSVDEFSVGFIQNLVESTFEAEYQEANGNKHTLARVTTYLPMLDIAPAAPKWRRPPFHLMPVVLQERNQFESIGAIEDNPDWGNWSTYIHKWKDNQGVEHTGELIKLTRNDHYRTFVVVQYSNPKNANDSNKWASRQVGYVDWYLKYNATVDIDADPVTDQVIKDATCKPELPQNPVHISRTEKIVTVGKIVNEDAVEPGHMVDR